MATGRGKQADPGLQFRPGLSRPLEALAFLLPLIAFSEIASRSLFPYTAAPPQDRVVAFHLLQLFFQLFGSAGALMPALAVVVVLLSTHVASRQPWRVRKSAVALMYAESLALAIPLILVNSWVRLAAGPAAETWLRHAALGIGAGVYEELVFRLVLISVVAVIGSDLLRWSNTSVLIAGVMVSALVFAAHHHPPVGGEPFDASRFWFRTLAGVYLGAVFVIRGYGPAAGTHAAYNLIVISLA